MYADLVPEILPILITVAFSQYVLDSYFLYRQKNLRMSFLGRWNGVFYFGPLLLISFARLLEDNQWNAEIIFSGLNLLTWALLPARCYPSLIEPSRHSHTSDLWVEGVT